jgi:hypothetical protein
MKTKVHKLLQITAIIVIALAAYASFKQVEGFQTPPAAPIPNSATLTALLNSTGTNPPPAWFTADRAAKIPIVSALAIQKGTSLNSDTNFEKVVNDAFTASKTAGQMDDLTFDAIIAAEMTYLNNYVPNSATLTALLNSTGTNPAPAWYTTERANAIKNLGDLSKLKGVGGPDDTKYTKVFSDTFTESKGKGEKDDVTFDKIIKAGTDYANSYTAPITNSATLQALFNVINPDPKPAWYTTERANALKKLGDLVKEKGGGPDNKGYQDALNKAFTDSKAKGDKDDITLDKVIKAGTDYLNSSNLPLYIGAGVGGVAILGAIGYFMF